MVCGRGHSFYGASRGRIVIAALLFITAFAFAEKREIVVLQTADVHAEMEQWPRLATLIKSEYKAGRTLLIDCGDTVQGSLLAILTKGTSPLKPILALPYDVWVPGNHELDFGYAAYIDFCKAASDRLLCANFQLPGQAQPAGWKVFERNGARIAVIGMQASFFRNWLVGKTANQFRCEKARDVLKRVLPKVCAEKPDAIILAIHQGWLESPDKRGVNEVHEIA